MEYNILKPGRIVKYDPLSQLAVVRVSNDITYSNSEVQDKLIPSVLLRNVPVHTPGGGNWHMTFPIKKGDPCLLSFSQFGYDHWLYQDKDSAGFLPGGAEMPWTRRQFSIRDGFAQVGFNTIPRAIADYSATDSEWRNVDRTQRMTLKETGDIEIAAGTTTVNITKDGAVTITATAVTLDTAQTNLTGNLDVAGMITTPSIEVDGIEVLGHNHTNPEGGNVGPMK